MLILISIELLLILGVMVYKLIPKKVEIDPEEELDKAVDQIREYCFTQTENGCCRFNLNGNNKECDCMLLKNPPEEWAHEHKKP